ncbi:hypothetical protein C6V83_00255 [Gordonia iterans]|uniref:Uncharacterized protein n=1 Tax=Gordonia iterans TaxID=1004901 RepID=A0A2S0KB86_9ACTN|nr:hypothetical protein [Gordonia iterans]AVL98946.1 hypothetical protein C6V83_00255 [Gordonia iterans]
MLLTPVDHPLPPPQRRIPGDILLPGHPQLEQEIVWVFPQLAQTPLSPEVVRRCVIHCWDWAMGAAGHRAAVAAASGDPSRRQVEAAAVAEHLWRIVEEMGANPPAEPALLAARLDQHADLFGPADATSFAAVQWGRRAEFRLAEERGPEAWRADTHTRARYSSFAAMNELDIEFFHARAERQIDFYATHAFDIAAVWHGTPTTTQLQHEAARRQRNATLLNVGAGALHLGAGAVSGVGAGFRAYGNWREARAAGAYRAAKTRYLNRSAHNRRY